MNLQELFTIQDKLDKRIVQEHGLQGQDLLDKKILSLQVEIGECANEWRGFKFWSKDQEPRTKVIAWVEDIMSENPRYVYKEGKNPLLEEYVDCLHFILSIGLELRIDQEDEIYIMPYKATFEGIFRQVSDLSREIEYGNRMDLLESYEFLVNDFLGLGESLGFTEQQIEQAYLDKNKINHTRQDVGY